MLDVLSEIEKSHKYYKNGLVRFNPLHITNNDYKSNERSRGDIGYNKLTDNKNCDFCYYEEIDKKNYKIFRPKFKQYICKKCAYSLIKINKEEIHILVNNEIKKASIKDILNLSKNHR